MGQSSSSVAQVSFVSSAPQFPGQKSAVRPVSIEQGDEVFLNRKGQTVLHHFFNRGIPVITNFLDVGVEIDAVDIKGNTVLMLAAQANNKELVKLLLERNANMNIQNEAGETALILAAKNAAFDIMTLLIARGALLATEDNEGNAFIAYLAPELKALLGALFGNRR